MNTAAPEFCYACCGFLLEHFCCLSGLLLNKHKAQASAGVTPQMGQPKLSPSQALRGDLPGRQGREMAEVCWHCRLPLAVCLFL